MNNAKQSIVYVPQGGYGILDPSRHPNVQFIYTAGMGPCCHIIVRNKLTNHAILCHADSKTNLHDDNHGIPAWIRMVCPNEEYDNLELNVGEGPKSDQKRTVFFEINQQDYYEAAMSAIQQATGLSRYKIFVDNIVSRIGPEVYGIKISSDGKIELGAWRDIINAGIYINDDYQYDEVHDNVEIRRELFENAITDNQGQIPPILSSVGATPLTEEQMILAHSFLPIGPQFSISSSAALSIPDHHDHKHAVNSSGAIDSKDEKYPVKKPILSPKAIASISVPLTESTSDIKITSIPGVSQQTASRPSTDTKNNKLKANETESLLQIPDEDLFISTKDVPYPPGKSATSASNKNKADIIGSADSKKGRPLYAQKGEGGRIGRGYEGHFSLPNPKKHIAAKSTWTARSTSDKDRNSGPNH